VVGHRCNPSEIVPASFPSYEGGARHHVPPLDTTVLYAQGPYGRAIRTPLRVLLASLADAPLNLLLGRDVYKTYREKLSGLMESIAEWKSVTLDVNFPLE
jgi:hypothetical protein